jgi:amino acid adenylation domain-containing protein
MNIAHHLRDAALESPDRTALHWEGGDVSYAELLHLAAVLRRAIPNVPRVGLLARRTPLAFAGAQAILSTGAACVPVNPAFPSDRNNRILELSNLTTLLVGDGCADSLAAILALRDGPLSIVAMAPADDVRKAIASRPEVTLLEVFPDAEAPDDFRHPDLPVDGTAYILFTSGSTGDPKGVRILHSNLERYFNSFLDAYPMFPDDRLSQTFDLTFDLSVHEQFLAWKAKATLVVFPEPTLSPVEFAGAHGVTVWLSVPSLVAFLESSRLALPGSLPGVRLSIFGGEKFTWNALQIWKGIAPNTQCVNIYGPTEVTIADFSFDIPDDYPESACHQGGIPLGKPLPYQFCEVRRPDGSVCAPMEEGILWLGGDQVTPGYLDAAKTAELFVPKDGMVWYRSGDVVFADHDGNVFFVGREDFQVKLPGGYRVELGEIEAALLRISGAAFAVADVARLRGDVDEIVCVLPTDCASRKKELRDAAKNVLMPHMVPRVWKFMDKLPTNANGKTDRKALKSTWMAELQAPRPV